MNAPRIGQDFSIIILSIIVAVYLGESGIAHEIAHKFSNPILGPLFAGILFTSIFTTAPSIAILGAFAGEHGAVWVGFIGGFGALIGDIIIFKFFRDRFANDIKELFSCTYRRKLEMIFEKSALKFITPLLGALIIASPFPDEFGIALLSISKVRTSFFIPISYIFNALGILLIGLVAISFT